MAIKSSIEWCSATWNPFAGCSKISQGCKNCYAIRDAHRLSNNTNKKIQKKYAGTVTADGTNWTGKINLDEEALLLPLRWSKPRKIFVNSMSDLFHENVPDEWIHKVFAVMALCPQHIFQVLTKRPQRMQQYMSQDGKHKHPHWGIISDQIYKLSNGLYNAFDIQNPFQNVWLGVSIEDQNTADERIPLLLDTPAVVRWLSIEPLLSEVNLPIAYCYNCNKFVAFHNVNSDKDYGCIHCQCYVTNMVKRLHETASIDWVVVGGESNGRPCDVSHIRSIVRQCRAAGIRVFVKQLGSQIIGDYYERDDFFRDRMFDGRINLIGWRDESDGQPPLDTKVRFRLAHRKGGDPNEWAEDLRIRQMPKVK